MHVLILILIHFWVNTAALLSLSKVDPVKWCCCSFKAMWNLIFQILCFFSLQWTPSLPVVKRLCRRLWGCFMDLGWTQRKFTDSKREKQLIRNVWGSLSFHFSLSFSHLQSLHFFHKYINWGHLLHSVLLAMLPYLNVFTHCYVQLSHFISWVFIHIMHLLVA